MQEELKPARKADVQSASIVEVAGQSVRKDSTPRRRLPARKMAKRSKKR